MAYRASCFRRWIEPRENSISLLEEVLKNQVAAARRKRGRHEAATFLMIDAQSVKNTDTAMEKGYGAGRKVSGIKWHIAIDTRGWPHMVKHLKNRNGVASPCRTICTVCGDAPCYAFLSIQLYLAVTAADVTDRQDCLLAAAS